jgi:hypothetical protein
MQDYYVREKLRQLEAERAARLPLITPRQGMPIAGALALGVGRLLRRVGEGLEAWAAPSGREQEERRRLGHGGRPG